MQAKRAYRARINDDRPVNGQRSMHVRRRLRQKSFWANLLPERNEFIVIPVFAHGGREDSCGMVTGEKALVEVDGGPVQSTWQCSDRHQGPVSGVKIQKTN